MTCDVGRPGSLFKLFVYAVALRRNKVVLISCAKYNNRRAQLVINASTIGGDRLTFSSRLPRHTIDSKIDFNRNRGFMYTYINASIYYTDNLLRRCFVLSLTHAEKGRIINERYTSNSHPEKESTVTALSTETLAAHIKYRL